MKINESKIKKIINEEMMMLDDESHMDHVDNEGGMAKSQLYRMAKYAIMLHDALEDETQLEAWVQSKITIASEYLGKVKHYLEYEMNLDFEDPELDIEDSEEYDYEPDYDHDISAKGQEAEPMMAVDREDVYEIDEEDANLMES